MSTVQKFAMGIIAIAMVTTLILPDRQTSKVLQAGGNFVNGTLKAAMGRG